VSERKKQNLKKDGVGRGKPDQCILIKAKLNKMSGGVTAPGIDRRGASGAGANGQWAAAKLIGEFTWHATMELGGRGAGSSDSKKKNVLNRKSATTAKREVSPTASSPKITSKRGNRKKKGCLVNAFPTEKTLK